MRILLWIALGIGVLFKLGGLFWAVRGTKRTKWSKID